MASLILKNGAHLEIPYTVLSRNMTECEFINKLVDTTLNVDEKKSLLKIALHAGVFIYEAHNAIYDIWIRYNNGDQELIKLAYAVLRKMYPDKYHHDYDDDNCSYTSWLEGVTQSYSQNTNRKYYSGKKKAKKVDLELCNTLVEKIQSKVEIVSVEEKNLVEKQLMKGSRQCCFCEKESSIYPLYEKMAEDFSPPNKFYCPSCLRNNYHYKDGCNILLLTFRTIFGYFYYEYYLLPKKAPLMYLSEIQDYINLHVDAGMQNPVFNYDPETYLWFIDFRRIGNGKKKMPIRHVYQTVVQILSCFNMQLNVRNLQCFKFYDKYKSAIQVFYEQRYRPEGQRLLAPTLKGCGINDFGTVNEWGQWQQVDSKIKITLEDTRSFSPKMMTGEQYWQKLNNS